MSQKPQRFLLDSTLRDGEQMPGICFTAEQKLKIASILDSGGVRFIEAGVPAMSKREKETISKIIENRKNAVVSVWCRMVPSDIKHAVDVNPDMIHISVPVSYPHIYSKLRKNKNWVVNQLRECLEYAASSGISLSAGFEDAFRSEEAFMATIAEILSEYGVKRIRLSDTVGVALPSLCRNVLREFSAKINPNIELGFHGHNDLGLAVANTVEAMKSGCLYADVTIGGIGERAGNCDFAKLARASAGVFDWGIFSPEEIQNEIYEVMRYEKFQR